MPVFISENKLELQMKAWVLGIRGSWGWDPPPAERKGGPDLTHAPAERHLCLARPPTPSRGNMACWKCQCPPSGKASASGKTHTFPFSANGLAQATQIPFFNTSAEVGCKSERSTAKDFCFISSLLYRKDQARS